MQNNCSCELAFGVRRVCLTTVILLQGSMESSMEVLGQKEPFSYDAVGTTALFVSDSVHRSGTSQPGVLKLVVFWAFHEPDSTATVAIRRCQQVMLAAGYVKLGGALVASKVYEATMMIQAPLEKMQNAAEYLTMVCSCAVGMLSDACNATSSLTLAHLRDFATQSTLVIREKWAGRLKTINCTRVARAMAKHAELMFVRLGHGLAPFNCNVKSFSSTSQACRLWQSVFPTLSPSVA